MPISDVDPYPAGHFRRVYEYIIRPACERAGFAPLRADEVKQTNHIVIDVLRHLVHAEMTVCDLSARNANVFYELGVRQAFNKPVTLLKDRSTPRVFDIQGLRDLEYDENLRVDTVGPTVDALEQALRSTYEAQGASPDVHVNSIVQLLGLQAATVPQPREVSPEFSLVLSSLSEVLSRLGTVETIVRGRAPSGTQGLLDFVAAGGDSADWRAVLRSAADQLSIPTPVHSVGSRVVHAKFGEGTVRSVSGSGRDERIVVEFDDEKYGRKALITAQARLLPALGSSPRNGAG